MKLVSAVAAALVAAQAHAVYLNPHGTGEALVYPYYTVNGGNSTLISITNTQNVGKAIKIRFLESQDSREVLDFNVYLSPFDMWVAQLVDKDGGAAIFTNDNSCTVPHIPTTAATALDFSTASFDGTDPVQFSDGGPVDIGRTREGSIEIIEMGTVTNASENTLTAISHVNGVPHNCAQVSSAWTSYWQADPTTDMAPATGGLYGSGTILNLARGTVQMYNADALGQFYKPDSPPMHTAHDALTPNLSSGTSKTSLTFVDDAAITTPFDKSIDAVSSVFMVDSVINDFWTSSNIGASSEWVLTFPTKRFYTDPQYVGFLATNALPPFDVVFGNTGTPDSCLPAWGYVFDREEASIPRDYDGPMRVFVTPCFAAQVLTWSQTIGEPSKIFGSPLSTNNLIALPFADGTARLYFELSENSQVTGTNGNIFHGLPVTGFWASQLINGSNAGALANFTAALPHKTHVSCDRGSPSLPCS